MRLSKATKVLSVGLLVAGIGVLVQYLTGVPGFPVVPPGPIVLGAAAVLVLLPWRWMPVLGLAAAVFVSVGAILATLANGAIIDRLVVPGDVGPFTGTVLQLVGLAVALVAGVRCVVPLFRRVNAQGR